MARCLVTRRLPGPRSTGSRDRHEVDVWPGDCRPRRRSSAAESPRPTALLCLLTDRVDRALLDAAPRLRAIANYAVGSDNIDLAAAAARGIPVGVTPDVLTERHRGPRDGAAPGRRPPSARGARRRAGRAAGGPGIRGRSSAWSSTARRWRWWGRGASGARWRSAPRPSGCGCGPLAAATTCMPRWPRADAVTLHAPLTDVDPPSDRRRRARGDAPDGDPREHRPRRARRPGSAGAGAARGAPSAPRRSTSPTRSLRRRTTRCCGHHACSSCRTSARRRGAPASGWRTSPSTTSSRRWTGGRCPIRRRRSIRPMRVAVVDIGTNSTRLLLADVDERSGAVTELERRTTVTRLGQGVDKQRRAVRRGDVAGLRRAGRVPRCHRVARRRRPGDRGADERRARRQQRRVVHRARPRRIRARRAHDPGRRGGAAHLPRRDERTRSTR